MLEVGFKFFFQIALQFIDFEIVVTTIYTRASCYQKFAFDLKSKNFFDKIFTIPLWDFKSFIQ